MEIREKMRTLEMLTLRFKWPDGSVEDIQADRMVLPRMLKQADAEGHFVCLDPEDGEQYEGRIESIAYSRSNEGQGRYERGGTSISFKQFRRLAGPRLLNETRVYTPLEKP